MNADEVRSPEPEREQPSPMSSGSGSPVDEVLELVREVCQAGDFRVEPRLVQIDGHYIHVELVGDDAAAVFSRHGRVLDAFQYVLNLMLAQKLGGDVRLLLDADGYRQRRQELLENLARKYAVMVKERQQECEFDPLPPHERRIIHRLFMNDPDVTTYSEGEEPDRKVILAPRKSQS